MAQLLRLFLFVCCSILGCSHGQSPISIKRTTGGEKALVHVVITPSSADKNDPLGQNQQSSSQQETVNVCLGQENVVIECTHSFKVPSLFSNGFVNFRMHLNVNGVITSANEAVSLKMSNDRDLTARTVFCSAENKEMSEKFYSKAIQIQYFDCSTPLSDESTKLNVAIGGNATLTCWNGQLENGYSSTPKIEWSFQGVWTEKPQLTETGSFLVVKNIAKRDIGSFICFVWFENLNYRYARKFDLHLLMPLTPIDIKTTISEQCAHIAWKSDGRTRLALAEVVPQWYKITYNKADRWDVDKPIVLTTNATKQVICNLTPNTTYRAEIRAVNKYGESQPVRHHFETSDSNTAVDSVSYDTELTAVLGQELVIPCHKKYNKSSWTDLKTEPARNSGLTGPHVIDPVKITDAGFYQCTAPDENGTLNSFITRMSILVHPKPLLEVKCSALSDGRAIITWKLPSDDAEDSTTTDTPDSYMIQYHILGNTGHSYPRWEQKTVSPDAVTVTIDGLESSHPYLVRLIAVNEAGNSPPKSVICRVM